MNGPYNRYRYDPDPDDSPKSAPCPTCGGRGTLNPDGVALGIGCRTCKGSGTVAVPPLLKWSTEP